MSESLFLSDLELTRRRLTDEIETRVSHRLQVTKRINRTLKARRVDPLSASSINAARFVASMVGGRS